MIYFWIFIGNRLYSSIRLRFSRILVMNHPDWSFAFLSRHAADGSLIQRFLLALSKSLRYPSRDLAYRSSSLLSNQGILRGILTCLMEINGSFPISVYAVFSVLSVHFEFDAIHLRLSGMPGAVDVFVPTGLPIPCFIFS